MQEMAEHASMGVDTVLLMQTNFRERELREKLLNDSDNVKLIMLLFVYNMLFLLL